MTTTTKILTAHPGPPARTPEWYSARRIGVTATEVRDLAKGYRSNRDRIMREKLTGDRPNLAGKPAIEYGNLREPLIAAWIERRFGIEPSDLLYIQDADPRALATPDGVEVDEFTGKVYVSETKTSKHDLTPGRIVDGVLVLTKGPGGKWYLQDNHFAKTGYYDQIQWQMFVMGAERTLFAWEQHDDDWSGWPQRAPKTITAEPGWCWVLRDDKRIAELQRIAFEFLHDLEQLRAEIEIGNAEPPALSAEEEESIAIEKRAQEIKHERIREMAVHLVAARQAVKDAEDERDRIWKALQDALADETDWLDDRPGAPRVSVVTNPAPTRKVVNREKMLAKAPLLVERYEKLVERYTETVTGDPKTTITVTARKA
jgi:hypothetical protein